jgi:hypothetical protein
LSFGPFSSTLESRDSIITPLDEAARCKTAEEQDKSRLSAPGNQAEKQQHPYKMCKGLLAMDILI